MRARNELLVEYFSLLVLIPIAVETEYVTGSLDQYIVPAVGCKSLPEVHSLTDKATFERLALDNFLWETSSSTKDELTKICAKISKLVESAFRRFLLNRRIMKS